MKKLTPVFVVAAIVGWAVKGILDTKAYLAQCRDDSKTIPKSGTTTDSHEELSNRPNNASLSNNRTVFCHNCVSRAGIVCHKRAHWLASRYNLSTQEAKNAVLQEDPVKCTLRDRRDEQGIPGTKDITSWCILGGNNTPPRNWVIGFSHSAQALVPCWSYFCRVREVFPDAKCGIWFQPPQGDAFQYRIDKQKSGWVSDLLRQMNCTYDFGTHHSPPNATWYFRPNNIDFDEWFQRPIDATHLTNTVLGNDFIPLSSDGNETLRIGLVQRRGQRRNITNLHDIQQRIQATYPSALVEWGEMEDLTLVEQAAFWNRQDVIVAAHGAAMTNVMFMRRGTAVVEIFPLHYYVFMYKLLCETIDVHHFAWIDNVQDPEKDFAEHAQIREVRYQLRANPLTPPIDGVMDLVTRAVDAVCGRSNCA